MKINLKWVPGVGNMTQITIGELLRRHRLEASLTQKELSELIPFSYTTTSRVETDKQRPAPEYIEHFISALHLPKSDIEEIWAVYAQKPPSFPIATDAKLDETLRPIRQAYHEYLVKELQYHTIRGFAPQVGGTILSLPLAKIFLPLQAVAGRPTLAQYAEEDLQRQALGGAGGELDWQDWHHELDKRHAELSLQQAAQQTLTLAELLKNPRAILLGDPGTGASL